MANGSHWQMDEPMSSLSFAHQMSQPPSQKGGMPGTPAGQLPSSAGGAGQEDLQFRTFEPRSREQRRADLDKTSREKARIAQRYPNAEPPPCEQVQPLSWKPSPP